MNRNASPKQNVPRPSTSKPMRVDDAGRGERGDDRPRVQRAGPAVDRPLDEERQADGQDEHGAEVLELREHLLEQEQPAEDEQEDADPGQPRSAGLVRPPLPGVDLDVGLAGRAAAAARRQAGDRIGRRRPSSRSVPCRARPCPPERAIPEGRWTRSGRPGSRSRVCRCWRRTSARGCPATSWPVSCSRRSWSRSGWATPRRPGCRPSPACTRRSSRCSSTPSSARAGSSSSARTRRWRRSSPRPILPLAAGDPERAIALAGGLALISGAFGVAFGRAPPRAAHRPPVEAHPHRLSQRHRPDRPRRPAAQAVRVLGRRGRAGRRGPRLRRRAWPAGRRSRRRSGSASSPWA